MSRRRMLSYALCLLVFAAGVALSIRLSFPPDPWAARFHVSARPEPEISVDGTVITVRTEGQRRRYEIFGTDRGLVAREAETRRSRQEP